MASREDPSTLLDALALISSGKATVTVGGYPFLSVRSDERELDVEARGAKAAGMNLSQLIRLQEGGDNILVASERAAQKLSSLRWRLNLYDKGSRVVTMGSGVSKLTAHVALNPLKLKSLMEALR